MATLVFMKPRQKGPNPSSHPSFACPNSIRCASRVPDGAISRRWHAWFCGRLGRMTSVPRAACGDQSWEALWGKACGEGDSYPGRQRCVIRFRDKIESHAHRHEIGLPYWDRPAMCVKSRIASAIRGEQGVVTRAKACCPAIAPPAALLGCFSALRQRIFRYEMGTIVARKSRLC
jgi:hypothetical protein